MDGFTTRCQAQSKRHVDVVRLSWSGIDHALHGVALHDRLHSGGGLPGRLAQGHRDLANRQPIPLDLADQFVGRHRHRHRATDAEFHRGVIGRELVLLPLEVHLDIGVRRPKLLGPVRHGRVIGPTPRRNARGLARDDRRGLLQQDLLLVGHGVGKLNADHGSHTVETLDPLRIDRRDRGGITTPLQRVDIRGVDTVRFGASIVNDRLHDGGGWDLIQFNLG